MRRAIKIGGFASLALVLVYVGSFSVLVARGRGYAERQGLQNAYFLADPESEGGVDRHYRRGRFFSPLVYITRHWTGGPYLCFPDSFTPAPQP